MPFRVKQPLVLPLVEACHEIVRSENETFVEIMERSSFDPPILDPVQNFDLANQIAAGVPLRKVSCTREAIPSFVSENKE